MTTIRTIKRMTIKERLHQLVDELSEAEASRARIVVEDERFLRKRRDLDERETSDAYTTSPQFASDGWADLAKPNTVYFGMHGEDRGSGAPHESEA